LGSLSKVAERTDFYEALQGAPIYLAKIYAPAKIVYVSVGTAFGTGL
jgi:hypothetical protein